MEISTNAIVEVLAVVFYSSPLQHRGWWEKRLGKFAVLQGIREGDALAMSQCSSGSFLVAHTR